MQLRYTFRFQQIGQTWLGAAVGQNAHLFNGVLQLNEVGHFIVSELEEITTEESACPKELTEEDLVAGLTQRLTKEYAVDESTAQSAVQDVLNYLRAEHVLD